MLPCFPGWSMKNHSSQSLLIAVSIALSACGVESSPSADSVASSSSEDVGTSSQSTRPESLELCVRSESEISDLKAPVEHLVPAELLRQSAMARTGTWQKSSSPVTDWMTLEPSSVGVKGTLEFRYAGVAKVVRESERDPWPDNVPRPDVAANCKNQIELSMQILFTSSNGALQETWEGLLIAPLYAPRTKEPSDGSFVVKAEHRPAAFQGTTRFVKLPVRDGFVLADHRLHAEGRFSQGSLGSFSVFSSHHWRDSLGIASASDIEHYVFEADLAYERP